MSLKNITYFLLILLLASAGTVISEPTVKIKSGSKSQSLSLKVSSSVSVDNYKLHTGLPQRNTGGTGGLMPASISEPEGYLYKNYLLSERYIYHNSNSGRTVIRFTSRFRN